MALGFGLGLGLQARAISNRPPGDIELSNLSVDEDETVGTVIGELSAVDPDGGPITFSLTDDAGGLFDVDGTDLVLVGGLDYETATSHSITVRATDNAGLSATQQFTITVNNVAEDPGGIGEDDGDVVVDDEDNFDIQPTVVDISGGVKFVGKKKANGASGKFIFDIGASVAGKTYTITYDPNFALLANGGVTAMVAFCLKGGNDFRLSGLRGDGSTGLKAYEVSGDNLWNQTSGFTEVDGGAALHGTQAGPNWLQIEFNGAGTAYTLRTSADGIVWDDEFTGVTPAPFTNISEADQFGIAVFLQSADSGNFEVRITLWEEGNWVTSFSATMNASSLGWNGNTLRQQIPASLLSESGSKFRLSITSAAQPTSAENSHVNVGYAAHKSTAGGAHNVTFDTAQSGPRQLTYQGATSYTVTNPGVNGQRNTIVLDPVTYNFDETRDFVYSFYFANSAADSISTATSGVNGANKYEKAGNDASTAVASGYTGPAANSVYFVSKIEVFQVA